MTALDFIACGTEGTSDQTTATSTASGTGGGADCSSVFLPNYEDTTSDFIVNCNKCLHAHCCADLVACVPDPTCLGCINPTYDGPPCLRRDLDDQLTRCAGMYCTDFCWDMNPPSNSSSSSTSSSSTSSSSTSSSSGG